MCAIFSYNNLSGATKKVYDYLYNELINNRLPPGSTLSELDISKKLQTSRSPVREATMVLESEGLVRRYPGRGCIVSEITMQDINEIFALRILLEREALEKSYYRIDRQKLLELERDLEALTPEDSSDAYFDTDRRFHELLTSNCGNMRLIMILRTLNGQIEQFRRISAKEPRRLQVSRQEHLEVVWALKEDTPDRASQLLAVHIQNVQASTMSAYMQTEFPGNRPWN